MIRFDAQFHEIVRSNGLWIVILHREILQARAILQELVFAELERLAIVHRLKALQNKKHKHDYFCDAIFFLHPQGV